MARMIETDAFDDYLAMIQKANENKYKDYVYWLGYAREHLKDFAEVEGIEIVRCKDCTSYNTKGCASGFGWCEAWDQGRMDDNFCHCGERKNNE